MTDSGTDSTAGWAIVTGASSGIGAALAPRLTAAGYDVLLVARRAERLEETVRAARAAGPGEVRALSLDVTDPDALARLQTEVPAPTLLVNNAGAGLFGSALEHPPAEQAKVVRLNCEALTLLTLGYLPAMVEQGRGVIVNLGSIAGLQPVPFYAVYGASKAYVQSFSEALDEELRGTGVRVVSVCPGPVPTEFQGKAGSPSVQGKRSSAIRSPEQIADACLRAIARPQRVVIPAPVHRLMYWAQRFLPRATVVGMAGRGMRKRH